MARNILFMATLCRSAKGKGYWRQVKCREKRENLCAGSEASWQNVTRVEVKRESWRKRWTGSGRWRGRRKQRSNSNAACKWRKVKCMKLKLKRKEKQELRREQAEKAAEGQLTSWRECWVESRREGCGVQHKTKRRKWKIISAINDHVISAWNLQADHGPLPSFLPHNVCAGT